MQTAIQWFAQRQISDDITLIWEPHVHSLLRCNIWHIRGRHADLLVDTGLGCASLKSAIAELTDKPIIAVATHIHYDHVGGLHEFDTRVMHTLEASRMADYQEFTSLKTAAFPADWLSAFPDDGFDDYLINALPSAKFAIDDYAITSVAATRQVIEHDVIDLGDRQFEVLHLPGHSPGSLGLWEAATGTLFSGDSIYDGLLLDELEDSSIADYIVTMKRLREMKVNIVHGGHEASFGRSRLVELADEYLAWRDP